MKLIYANNEMENQYTTHNNTNIENDSFCVTRLLCACASALIFILGEKNKNKMHFFPNEHN